jgi:hypothetical protein
MEVLTLRPDFFRPVCRVAALGLVLGTGLGMLLVGTIDISQSLAVSDEKTVVASPSNCVRSVWTESQTVRDYAAANRRENHGL